MCVCHVVGKLWLGSNERLTTDLSYSLAFDADELKIGVCMLFRSLPLVDVFGKFNPLIRLMLSRVFINV